MIMGGKAINSRELRRLYETMGVRGCCQHLSEALSEGHLKPSDFSVRDLFEGLVEDGRTIADSWNPRQGGGVNLIEAGDAINTAAFANISGQIVYSEILAKYDDPMFLGDQLCVTTPTQFNGEKIAGIARLGDQSETIDEAHPYPTAGTSEEWIETPVTTKRGFIVPVTKEAIYFDRTGVILERAGEVGYYLGLNKERRILDAVLGITDLYRRNGSAAIATYGDNSGTHNWDNLAASNALADWTDIEAAELLFDAITDPNTGDPIPIMVDTIIVPTALKHTARRIVNATELRTGDITTGTGLQTVSANTLDNYNILTSQLVKERTSSASTWFIGQPKKAFRYMENWPITVVQSPSNSEVEFTHDIVQRFKVSERGTVAVIDPRYMVKCTA